MRVDDLFSLKNKVVLITGGEGLYGRCILEGLAEAGGTVITNSSLGSGSEPACSTGACCPGGMCGLN